jgi:hypothetical protein
LKEERYETDKEEDEIIKECHTRYRDETNVAFIEWIISNFVKESKKKKIPEKYRGNDLSDPRYREKFSFWITMNVLKFIHSYCPGNDLERKVVYLELS